MSNISVIILTHNEEKNIRECIESALPLSGEILILDDHSTDETVKIALSLGAKVLNLPEDDAAIEAEMKKRLEKRG